MGSVVLPRTGVAPGPMVNLGLQIGPRVVAGIDRMAAEARTSRSAYAAALLNAAYTARCAETGDRDLDAAVGRVALLMGAGLDVAAIADLLGLRPETVQRIHDGWLRELCGRADA